MRVGAVVVAATSAAGDVLGEDDVRLQREDGRAQHGQRLLRGAWSCARPAPTRREGAAGRCRYGRGSSPTERTLWSRATPTTSCGARLEALRVDELARARSAPASSDAPSSR